MGGLLLLAVLIFAVVFIMRYTKKNVNEIFMEELEEIIMEARVSAMSDNDRIEFEHSDIVLAKYGGKYFMFDKSVQEDKKDAIVRSIPEIDAKAMAMYPTKEFIIGILRNYYVDTTRFVVDDNLLFTGVYDIDADEVKSESRRTTALNIKIYQVDKQSIMRIKRNHNLSISKINGNEYNYDEIIRHMKEDLKEKLLTCDEVRCGLERYDEALLSNPQRGHWDLHENPQCNAFGFVPRNPKTDVNQRVVGIDFGTKSTVVYYLKETNDIMPIPIGDVNADYRNKNRYENPTILHFKSLAQFITDYKSRNGRPETKWEDLTAAHTAQTEYDGASSEHYSSFLSHLKQWASGLETLRMRAENEQQLRELPAFSDIEESDWNPIEYYAYFIGLHINNMRNTKGIYLKYYLSYTITCPKEIREKIRACFERGLRKSLPDSLLKDQDVMKDFKVLCRVSEPTAYAVCALQEYCVNAPTPYAVFDFGGGTTDFDFGMWHEGDDDCDFYIESYGGEGIKTCGGENILEDLACEVFKQNIDKLIEEGTNNYCPFKLGPTSREFLGSDRFCVVSANGDRNMHILVELLRPFWENSEVYLNDDNKIPSEITYEASTDGMVQIFPPLLFNNEGKEIDNLKLNVSKKFIKEFIAQKINFAVENFFSALTRFNFGSDVKVFLAGNSSQSPYVMAAFTSKQDTQTLDIYPPLGTDAAKVKMDKLDIKYDYSEEKPNGKTGVAFGLISCREGGEVEILPHSDTPLQFLYYVGKNRRKYFVIPENMENSKPVVGQWYSFRKADVSEFNVYYTDKPNCLGGGMSILEAKITGGSIPDNEVDASKTIFVRAIAPQTLEYAVADSEENISRTNVQKIILD